MKAILSPLFLVLCFQGLAGCMGGHEDGPPLATSSDSPTPSPSGEMSQALPPMLLPVGGALRYVLDAGFNARNHVDMDLTTTFHASQSVTMQYRYPERPEFDTNLEGEFAPDGSWVNVSFDCEPVFP